MLPGNCSNNQSFADTIDMANNTTLDNTNVNATFRDTEMKSEPDMQTKSSSSDNGVGMYKISFMGP